MKPPFAVSDLIELRIDKPVYRGLGLGRHEGCVVFVPGTYGGERVAARVLEIGRGYARAELQQLLESSPARREPPCRHAERCGGCSYQPLAYQEQLLVKEAILRESLARARVSWDGPVPVKPSPESGWRLRAELHVDWRGEQPRLGFHEAGTHELVDVEHCQQLSYAMNAAVRGLRAALLARRPLSEHVRSVELSEAIDGSGLVACLVTDLDVRRLSGLSGLAELVPGLRGLLARPAAEQGPLAALALSGDPFVTSRLLGLELRAHQQSFFQSNRFLVEPLARTVLERVEAGGPVLDMYAGVGLFALPLAARGDDVVAFEVNPLAAADARANALLAGLGNLRIEATDVESGLRLLPARPGERIVLDPPRDGASRLALRALAARGPTTITYVSCDPPTLGRDLNLLAGLGYRLVALDAFDMFPDTFHVESIAHLERTAAL